MTPKKSLGQTAIEVANEIQERALRLQPELLAIETRKAEIQAQLNAAKLCHDRLASFQPQIGMDYQCPRCWISNEISSPLTPIPGTDHEDFFKCVTCQWQFSIPLR
jgi:hypothetical protein